MAEFDWTIEASDKSARKILHGEIGKKLSHWPTVVREYSKAKIALINALNPETGRKEIPFLHELLPTQLVVTWRAALQWEARNQAERRVSEAQARLDTATPEYVPSSIQALERANKHHALMVSAQSALSTFASIVQAQELSAGEMTDSPICTIGRFGAPGIRKGMKLTRALGVYLREAHEFTRDQAAQIVDAVSAAAQATPRKSTIVLSANIFDILFSSEHCSYESCHSLDGCHRAGPQQYLQDPHTIVVYAYDATRTWNGLDVPYKLFRQIAYVDAKRQSAALQKHYGQPLPAAAHSLIRREVALMLHYLRDQKAPDSPHWFHAKTDRTAEVLGADSVAYIDCTRDYVSLHSGARPFIKLASCTPCPCCGENITSANTLSCCGGDDEYGRCCSCNRRLTEDDCCNYQDESYCQSCFSENFSYCDCCNEDYPSDQVRYVQSAERSYCDECFGELFTRCVSCREDIRKESAFTVERPAHADRTYCKDCYSDHTSICEVCEESFHVDDLTDDKCADCIEKAEQERAADLCARLTFSPRWERLSPCGRWYLSLQWENTTNLDSTSLDSLICFETSRSFTFKQESMVSA
jgi:hypothetical protein